MRVTERTSKDERVEARVTAEIKKLFLRAAALEGRSVTDFIVHSSVEAAKRVIRENDYLEFSQRDRIAFVEAVLNPPLPGERLKRAAQRHEQILGD
jgi:uncharacterized protein (DUF1778 family)